MRRENPSLAATATTLVALVAMAAGSAAATLVRADTCARPVERHVATASEGSAVRAVAALMAAAARDLLAPNPLQAVKSAQNFEVALAPQPAFAPRAESRASRIERPPLAARLLDLPPPLG
jgi:hypothetical protein